MSLMERGTMRKRAAAAALALMMLCCAAGCSAPAATDAPESLESEFGGVRDERESQSAAPAPAPAPSAPKPAAVPTLDERAAEKAASLTLEQKVAQLFVVTPEAITGVDTATQAGSATQQALAAYPVGGLVYFQKNLLTADQTREMIANSQAFAQDACGLPLLVGVDEEGGTVSRIGGNPGFDISNEGNMADVGAAGDTAQAKAVAARIGGYLSDLGFNLDFAPDSDVCGDPSTDVMALRYWELAPFKAAIDAGVPMVMVGHLTAPNAFGSDVPASLNPAAVTDLLRGELGFQGLVITDSLSMGAVGDFCTPDQAGVAALEAGADLVLMPEDFAAAYQGVLDAVSEGALSEERIDQSVLRIVKAKLAFE